MAVLEDGTTHLTSLRNEYRKQYFVYDGDGNPTHIYEARPNARSGDPCLVTKNEWSGGKLIKSVEYKDSWDSDWDLAPD